MFGSQDFNSHPKRLVAPARSRKSSELPIDLSSDGFGIQMLQNIKEAPQGIYSVVRDSPNKLKSTASLEASASRRPVTLMGEDPDGGE